MKAIEFLGASKKDLRKMPKSIKETFGHAFYLAQEGGRYIHSKVLKGFGNAGVIEVIEHDSTGTYRGVYTVKFEEVIYVLHVFHKKSKSGTATPKRDKELILQRLKEAEQHYHGHYNI